MKQAQDPISDPDATWQDRLDHIVETMRMVSEQTTPEDMTRIYSERTRHALNTDRFLSITRRGVSEPDFIVARDHIGDDNQVRINPFVKRDVLPRLSGGMLSELLYSNRPHVLTDFEVDDSDPAADYLRGHRLLIGVPVFDDGESKNMIIMLFNEPDSFDVDQLPQIVWTTNLFGRATHSLVLNRRLSEAYGIVDREMKAISDIQVSLLPENLPDIPGLDVAAYYQPAAHAGGDYYDFFPLSDNRWGILIADVSGHGSPAAVIMAITHTLAHTRTGEMDTPGHLLEYVNNHLTRRYTSQSGAFVTAFFAIYDPEKRTLTYSSAGHPPPRVKRCSDDSMLVLNDAGGVPLGILEEHAYPHATLDLNTGDQIIFYTDGITETFNKEHDMYGIERMDGVLSNCALTARGLINEVLESVNTFSEGRMAEDDRTILVARAL